MTHLQRAIDAYGHARETLAPLQQIVMLYDGAIQRIRDARSAHARHRFGDRQAALDKAVAILEGLQSGLDHARGGEIADNLDRLYSHLTFRLHQLAMTNDVTICDEAEERLLELRAAWAELGRQPAPAPRRSPLQGERQTSAQGSLAVVI